MEIKIKIIKDKIIEILIWIFSLFICLPLFIILFQITKQGIHALLHDGLNQKVITAAIGSIMLITISTIISIIVGIPVGMFLNKNTNSKFLNLLRTLINVIQGLPSIVVGILAYLWIVVPMKSFSALSGAIALSLIMLPIVIKSTEESIKLVPQQLIEASYSLGASYTMTLCKIILPTAGGGIISGILIGISRIAGETAPLLFTAFGNPYINLNPLNPTDALPLLIFNYAMSPYSQWHRISWEASFILVIFVLTINITVKLAGRLWKT